MRRPVGILCFVLGLGGVITFEVVLALIVGGSGGSCASGTTAYAIARPCPPGVAQLLPLLMVSLLVALGGGIFAANILGVWAARVFWAALFVPLGVGFGIVAHYNNNAIVAWGLAAMFAIMGLAPIFMPDRALDQ